MSNLKIHSLASLLALLLLLVSPLIVAAATIPTATQAQTEVAKRDGSGTTSTAPLPSDYHWFNPLLSYVNKYRLQHKAVPYVWSNTLAAYALQQADKCAMKHSGGPYGENIYWISSPSLNFTKATQMGVDAWMSEQPLYNASNPLQALHYTALMWQASKHVGCAWSSKTCANANGGFYFFCEFDPMGNVVPLFPKNVYPNTD